MRETCLELEQEIYFPSETRLLVRGGHDECQVMGTTM